MAAVGGVWNSKAPLGGEGFASSVIDGKIYVSLGYRPGDSTRLDIYDIATDTWTVGVSGAVARSELVGAAAGGRVGTARRAHTSWLLGRTGRVARRHGGKRPNRAYA